jgi:hypothetical protein
MDLELRQPVGGMQRPAVHVLKCLGERTLHWLQQLHAMALPTFAIKSLRILESRAIAASLAPTRKMAYNHSCRVLEMLPLPSSGDVREARDSIFILPNRPCEQFSCGLRFIWREFMWR